MFANPARQTNRIHIFIARDVVLSSPAMPDETADSEHFFVPISAVPDAIEAGQFSQGLHIASYFRCIHYARRKSTAPDNSLESDTCKATCASS